MIRIACLQHLIRIHERYMKIIVSNKFPEVDEKRMLRKLKIGKDTSPHKCEVCGSSFDTPCALAKHQHLFCTGNF
jgi:hypothetical protein